MPTEAVTSGCSRTWTLYEPAALIGSGTKIFLRSISGPPAVRTASAMSVAPTEPNSRPFEPARRASQRSRTRGAAGSYGRSPPQRPPRHRGRRGHRPPGSGSASCETLVSSSLALASRAGVREQRHLACVLDRGRDVTLVPGAVPGDPARTDLAAVGDVLAQKAGVLVVLICLSAVVREEHDAAAGRAAQV